jgi:hypothetical protein
MTTARYNELPPPALPTLPPANDQEESSFVEITDPQSGKVIYANIVTGHCTWDRPPDGKL